MFPSFPFPSSKEYRSPRLKVVMVAVLKSGMSTAIYLPFFSGFVVFWLTKCVAFWEYAVECWNENYSASDNRVYTLLLPIVYSPPSPIPLTPSHCCLL